MDNLIEYEPNLVFPFEIKKILCPYIKQKPNSHYHKGIDLSNQSGVHYHVSLTHQRNASKLHQYNRDVSRVSKGFPVTNLFPIKMHEYKLNQLQRVQKSKP